MNMKNWMIGLTVTALCGWVGSASADVILVAQGDFNVSPGLTQSGFTALTAPASGNSVNYLSVGGSGLNVSVTTSAANFISRDRGTTGTTYAPLYRDFISSGNLPVVITFSNLTPNAQYQVEVFSFDGVNNVSGNTIWSVSTGTLISAVAGGANGTSNGTSVTISQVLPATLNGTLGQYAAIFTATSNNTGTIALSASGSALRLNGFSVSTVIPEPATLGLLAIGGLLMLHRKR